MKTIHACIAIVALAAAPGAWASDEKASHDLHPVGEAKSADGAYTEGEVRKVDKDASKITLKHGPIANLGMPAMSMVFRAADPAMLDKVKEGDKVRFKAEKVAGALTITQIEPSK